MKKPIPKTIQDWLIEETTLWQKQSIIQPSQADEILGLYHTFENTTKTRAVAFYSLVSAASVLAGLSLLLVLGYNWDYLGYIPRLAILFGITLGFQTASFLTRFLLKGYWLPETMALLACIGFGTAIVLISQTFNLHGNTSEGVWWWIIGCIPVAFLGQGPLVWVLITFLEIYWAAMICFGDPGGPWHIAGWNTGLHSGPYILPLLLAPGICWSILKQCPYTIALQAHALTLGCCFLFIAWGLEAPILLIWTTFFATTWAIGVWHGGKFTHYLKATGMGLSVISLIALSYHDLQLELFKEARVITLLGHSIRQFSVVVFPVSLLALPCILLLRCTPKTRKTPTAPEFLLGYILLLTWSVFLSPFIPIFTIPPMASTLAANALILGLSAKWMDDGWTRDNGQSFFAGTALFLLWTILRYFDLFGDVGGMLGASALFLISALVLLFLAIFWRRKKGETHAN